MASRTHTYKKEKARIQTPDVSTAPAQGMFESRPFEVESQQPALQQQLDLNTALTRSQRYGHSLSRMQFAQSPGTSVQPKMRLEYPLPFRRVTTPPLQAKLTIGEPGDRYEQEADRIASQVVQQINAPDPQQSTQSQPVRREAMPDGADELKKPEKSTIQREDMPDEEPQMRPMLQLRTDDGGTAATPDLEASIQQARGGGQLLADKVREPMEQAVGADFSGVKVHTDSQSDQLNRSIQARAFTTGQDVFFRQGEYNPESRGGQELLAHELTHVMQQNGSAVQAKPGVVQRVADNIVQRVFDPKSPATYDDDGGHSYADHGNHTTATEHQTRLTTGLTPSGRNSMPPDGKSSKFASDAMHSAAMIIAVNDLNVNKKNRAGGWKKGYSNHYTLAGVGETYELDTSGSNLKPTTTPCNHFYVAWSNDGAGDNFKLITMYPKP